MNITSFDAFFPFLLISLLTACNSATPTNIMSQLLVWGVMFCFSLILIACGSETLLPPLSNTPESIASSTALSTPELAQTTTANAINNTSPIVSSTSPLSAELSLQERIKTSAVVFYTTQRGVEPFPLLAWPELTILNRPEFSDI